MLDTQVANWINSNYNRHNICRNHNLTRFNYNGKGVLNDGDFNNYLNWLAWSKETSKKLKQLTGVKWRARDVEMAVFTAQRNNLALNPLKD